MMIRFGKQISFLLAALLLAVSFPKVAHSAETPLDVIPKTVSLVVRLKAPKTIVDKASKISDVARLGLGQFIVGQWASIGQFIGNPNLDGIDQKGEFWIAVFFRELGPPDIVLIIPGSDLDDMKDAIDASYEFTQYKTWGVYSKSKGAMKRFEECIAGKAEALGEFPDEKTTEVFNQGDANLFINLLEIKKTYQDRIDQSQEVIKKGLQEAKEQIEKVEESGDIPGSEDFDMEEVFKFYENLIPLYYQAIADAESYTFSIKLDDSGVIAREYFQFQPESQTAKFFAQFSPATSSALTQLPKDQRVYLEFSGKMIQSQMETAETVLNFFKHSEEKKKEIASTIEKIKALKFGNMGLSLALGDLSEGTIRSSVVGNASPGSDFKEAIREILPVISNYELAGMKQEVELVKDAETYGNLKADISKITQTIAPEYKIAEEVIQPFMEALYGPEGVVTRTVYLPDAYIQTLGGGRAQMEAAIKAQKEGASMSEGTALKRDRSRLPEKTDITLFVDAPNLLIDISRKIIEAEIIPMIPVLVDTTPLTDLKLSQSYLGWSLATTKEGVHMQYSIPLEQIKNWGKLYDALLKMQRKQPPMGQPKRNDFPPPEM